MLSAQVEPTKDDFTACYKRNSEAYISVDNNSAIAITSDRAVMFGGRKKPNKYIKYDPFMDLYVIKSSKELSFVPQNEERALKKGAWLASVDKNAKIDIGKLESLGRGLEEFDKLSTFAPKGSIITGVCCDMYGLGKGNKSFIGNRYLEHIVAYDYVYYGDVGARFKLSNSAIEVVEIDPFSATKLHIKDKITHLNKEPINSIRVLNETILFAPKNSLISMQVLRNGKNITIKLPIRSLPIVPKATRTYMESLGMSFDMNLQLKNVAKSSVAKLQGLEPGDKLLQVGQTSVKTPKSLRVLLSSLERGVTHHMLFERNGFQFFIKLTLPVL